MKKIGMAFVLVLCFASLGAAREDMRIFLQAEGISGKSAVPGFEGWNVCLAAMYSVKEAAKPEEYLLNPELRENRTYTMAEESRKYYNFFVVKELDGTGDAFKERVSFKKPFGPITLAYCTPEGQEFLRVKVPEAQLTAVTPRGNALRLVFRGKKAEFIFP